LFALGRW